MYYYGDGGDKDYTEATVWFWLATSLGDRYAKEWLRVLTGIISPRQLAEARKRAEGLWKKIPHDMKIKRSMTMH